MPVGALLAPELAGLLFPAAVAEGGLGAGLLTAGLGAGLGAGSGAAFGELTGEGAGKGALSGAIGGAAGPIGGAAGEALGIGSTAGSIIGGAAGGAGGAAITGQSPLLGAVEGAAVPAVNAAFGVSETGGPTSGTANVTPMSGAGAGGGPAGTAGSAGAQTAATTAPLSPDPTASGGTWPPPGSALGGTISGGGSMDGAGSAMGLSGFGGTGLSAGDVSAVAGDPNLSLAGYQAAGGTPGGSSMMGDIGSRIMGLVEKNPGLLLSGGLLATQLFRGNQQFPAEGQIQNLATNVGTEGQALQSYIMSGTLPPGAQQAVTSATNSAKATIRSNYAQLGLSGSTMEAQALSEVDNRAAAQTFQMADQLLSQGANYTQLQGQLYNELLKSQMAQEQGFQNALMSFAGGLGGLRGGT